MSEYVKRHENEYETSVTVADVAFLTRGDAV